MGRFANRATGMSWAVSERWKDAARSGGPRILARLTVTPPGGEKVNLRLDGLKVTKSLASGARFQADVSIIQEPGKDMWGLATTPGAQFAIDVGYLYAPGDLEWIPMGRVELSREPSRSTSESISLTLSDRWWRLEQQPMVAVRSTPAGQRHIDVARDLVLEAIPGQTFRSLPGVDSRTIGKAITWDASRVEALNTLQRDGGFVACFGADGVFEFRPEPSIDARAPVAAFRTGDMDPNLLSVSVENASIKLWNAAVCTPDEGQAWSRSQSLVEITDTTHPRHKSKIGRRVLQVGAAPSASTASQARNVATGALRRALLERRTMTFASWGHAHLEPGDTVTVVFAATWAEPARTETHLVETVTHDCLTNATDVTTRSTPDDVQIEEAG